MKFFNKSIRNLISKTAPVEAAAAPAGPVTRVLTTAPVEAAAAPAGRGIFGKMRQAVQQVGPATQKNPAEEKAKGLARGIGRGIGRGLKRMGFKDGGSVKASRSVVSSGRGDGVAIRGKTKCKMY
jgi:hypothetical protein